jgi:hypothetical protein
MARFYTADTTISHVEGIGIVKDVLHTITGFLESLFRLFDNTTDLFGDALTDDPTIKAIHEVCKARQGKYLMVCDLNENVADMFRCV